MGREEQGQGLLASSSSAGDAQQQGEKKKKNLRGWGRLDEGLLPLVASSIRKTQQPRLGPAKLVCRQWAAELPQGCTSLFVSGKGPDGWEHRYCGLQALTWVDPENTGKPCLPKLKTLRLWGCSDGDLQMLRNLPSLTSLNLTDCWNITDAGLEELSHLSTLTSLDLNMCDKITDTGLKELGHLANTLTSLDLSQCGNITDAGLKELGNLSSLNSLNLIHCSKITNEGLNELEHSVPNLTSLRWGI